MKYKYKNTTEAVDIENGGDYNLFLFFLDFGRQHVTFLPFEEDAEGQVCLKRDNIYQIQLRHQDCEEW